MSSGVTRCVDRRLIGHHAQCVLLTIALCIPLIWNPQVRGEDGTETEGPPAVPEAELYRPTRMPDRIVLTWDDDPATTQAVTWRTSTDVKPAYAEIAPAAKVGYVEETRRIGFDEHSKRLTAETSFFKTNTNECHTHVARFTGLMPETRYAYRVGDGTNWSEWLQFRTASRDAKPFTFIYFGDSQNDLRPMWPWIVRESFQTVPRMAFTLHAGDLTSGRGNDPEWGDWHYAMSWINGMVPVIATPGNHETITEKDSDDNRTRYTEPHWRAQFTLPENGPEGFEETVYYLDYQGVRIISLNSSDKQAEQIPWLERTLSENDNRWTIVTFHHPIFATAERRESSTRSIWKPVFDRHDVDLVLNGHDHTYSRTGLVSGEGSHSQTGRGSVYVVSVSGPKPYKIGPAKGEPREQFVRLGERLQLFQVISIDGSTLRYESRTAYGELYDVFEMKKHADGTKELIDLGRDMPNHLRD